MLPLICFLCRDMTSDGVIYRTGDYIGPFIFKGFKHKTIYLRFGMMVSQAILTCPEKHK